MKMFDTGMKGTNHAEDTLYLLIIMYILYCTEVILHMNIIERHMKDILCYICSDHRIILQCRTVERFNSD